MGASAVAHIVHTPVAAYVALGSNLGDRQAHLRAAVVGLAAHPAVTDVRASPVYETQAHTRRLGEVQPPYLNAVVALRTRLAPEALLAWCLHLEQQRGRFRPADQPWAPRTLDLDLLAYEAMTCHTDTLHLPHPRLGVRRFVLVPWADLAPGFLVPPPYAAPVADLLARCPDTDQPVPVPITLSDPL